MRKCILIWRPPPYTFRKLRGPLEFFLQLSRAQVFANVLQLLNVNPQRALYMFRIGRKYVAPQIVRAERKPRHVDQA